MPKTPGHRRRRVCLFGTSADPPTGEGGHLGIAAHLAAMDFDEVRILPVYRHMFGNKRGKQAPFRVRVEMCQLLFRDVPKVVVSEAERICFERASEGLCDEEKATIRIGTADLLDMLTKDEPDVDFTLALGADTFIDLASGKWRRTDDVINLVGRRMIVFRRRESDAGGGNALERDRLLRESIAKWQPDNAHPSIQLIQIPALSDVSSSAVRRSTDEAELKAMLSSNVLEYLQQNRMYSYSFSSEHAE
ncbi:hypothetical protein ACHAXT_013018 [Thalassiosira profunda]